MFRKARLEQPALLHAGRDEAGLASTTVTEQEDTRISHDMLGSSLHELLWTTRRQILEIAKYIGEGAV